MNSSEKPVETKFCRHCGQLIEENAVFCAQCGKQVGEINSPAPQQTYQTYQQPQPVIINNTVPVQPVYYGNKKDKWAAFLLCLFLGIIGAHKFYEGKIGMGILYIFTGGLFAIGWFIDLIVLLCKPNPYYV